MGLIAEAALAVTGLSLLPVIASVRSVSAFAARAKVPASGERPACTVLKPVCGAEPGLDAALASFCSQDYPEFQIVIGAHNESDPALDVVHRLRERFPAVPIDIVVDPALHGPNRKVSNLINMLPAARHDVLVIADSDMHVRPDYLARVTEALARPGAGLVTTVCAGEAMVPGIAAQLELLHLSCCFLPSALLAGLFRAQDCHGGTMALRRATLARIGGLEALVGHLADDNVLGRLVQSLGLRVELAASLPVLAAQERTLSAVWRHELRWARTIGALAPVCYAASTLQYPLFWALMAVVATGARETAVIAFVAVFAVRAGVALASDRLLSGLRARPSRGLPLWLLPVRDLLSVVEVVASFFGSTVVWRGHTMAVDRGMADRPPATPA